MEAKQDMGTTNKNTNMQSFGRGTLMIEFSTRNSNCNIESVLENRTLIQISQQHEYTKQIFILLPPCNIYKLLCEVQESVHNNFLFFWEPIPHNIYIFNNNESDAHNSNWMNVQLETINPWALGKYETIEK